MSCWFESLLQVTHYLQRLLLAKPLPSKLPIAALPAALQQAELVRVLPPLRMTVQASYLRAQIPFPVFQ